MRYIVISQSISVDLVPYSIRTNVFLFKIIHVVKIAPFPFFLQFSSTRNSSQAHSNASIFNMIIRHDTGRIGPLKKLSMSNASVSCGGLGVSRRSRAGDKKVSQRNWGSFDIYVPTYTPMHCTRPGQFWHLRLCVYMFIHVYINDLLIYSKSSSTYTYYTHIHRCTLYTAWTVLTYTQLADFGSGGDGRRQDKGQSHGAALGTMQCFVELWFVQDIYCCFCLVVSLSLSCGYMSIKQFDQGIMRYVYFCDIYIE